MMMDQVIDNEKYFGSSAIAVMNVNAGIKIERRSGRDFGKIWGKGRKEWG